MERESIFQIPRLAIDNAGKENLEGKEKAEKKIYFF
jgi:hypothetical protein